MKGYLFAYKYCHVNFWIDVLIDNQNQYNTRVQYSWWKINTVNAFIPVCSINSMADQPKQSMR